jgi:hypothetical protein
MDIYSRNGSQADHALLGLTDPEDKALLSFETSVSIHQSAWRNTTEDSNLQERSRKNLKIAKRFPLRCHVYSGPWDPPNFLYA